jgi:hypothetical protein
MGLVASPLVAPPVVKTKSLHCPNCGGPVELRGFGHALTVVCQQCLTVLDASTPELKIVQQVEEKYRVTPSIPLGQRGAMAGAKWEVIGFQIRTVYDEGVPYSWEEYLLFNPYKGFRYLTQYDGHWNFVTPLESQPVRMARAGRPAVAMDKRTFKHFSGAEATTTFVLGEFPWRVKVGEKVVCDDFIDPPTVLSSEMTEEEVTWSRGEYTTGAEVWKAFALPGHPLPTRGVYLNQPAPAKGGSMWGYFWLFVLGIGLLAMFFATFSRGDVVLDNRFHFSTADPEPSLVTPVFELKGRTAALELKVDANVSNNWVYFNFALINEDSGTAFDFGREVSYYSGTDSDGAWSEGGTTTTAYIPEVPPGRYYLRIEPEMDAHGRYRVNGKYVNATDYHVVLKHDVPNYSFFWIAAVLLLIPPIFHSARSKNFEVQRWMQSDYPPITRGGGGAD